MSDPIEHLRAALRRFALRASVRVAALAGDEAGCEQVLREEMATTLRELKLDVESDPHAQARLDQAVRDALAELDRLTGPGGD